MTVPHPLLVELRLAFKSCAKQHGTHRQLSREFGTFQSLFKKKDLRPKAPKKRNGALEVRKKDHRVPAPPVPNADFKATASPTSSQTSTELVPDPSQSTSVSGRRTKDAPMKVIPKAQVSPELTLSPKERLQIEFLTRAPPKTLGPKKVYKEQLLIYHGGLFRTNFLSIVKAMSLLVIIPFTFVAAPAYLFVSPMWWLGPVFAILGFVPFALVTFVSRPFVTWIHLVLPQHARQSAKAALEYSRNLPENAVLAISFYRSILRPASVEVNIADLVPATSRWRPVTFEWVGRRVDKGTWYRPNPTVFYVRPKSGTGKEARDTIPGIWENVYKRVVGIESGAVSKWKK